MADECVGLLGGTPKITSSRQLASVSFEQLGLTVSGGVAATLCEAMEVAREFKAAARAPTASAAVGSDGAGPFPFGLCDACLRCLVPGNEKLAAALEKLAQLPSVTQNAQSALAAVDSKPACSCVFVHLVCTCHR